MNSMKTNGPGRLRYLTARCWAQRVGFWPLVIVFLLGGAKGNAALLSFNSGTLNTAIPDNDANGITSGIAVSGQTDLISDVTVTLNLSALGGAGFNGDIYAYLTHDTINGFAVLLNRPGRSASNSIGTDGSGFSNVTFDDAATNGDVHLYEMTLGGGFNAGDALTGTWAPDGRNVDPANVLDTDNRSAFLSSFDGQVPNGNWSLFVADLSSGGTLRLDDWSLGLTVSPVPEPHHALVVALGLGWFALRRRRTNGATKREGEV